MVSYASSMRAYLEQQQHLASLRASIAQSSANIADLRRERRRWNDPAYVEAQARQRFGWVMPGEIGYQVIGENGEPLSGGDALPDADETTARADPVWWQAVWGSVEAAGNPPSAEPGPVDPIRAPKLKER